MSTRAAQFINRWEVDHVGVVSPAERTEVAKRLALQCREDAAKAGVSELELEGAVDGDLIGYIIQALSAVAFRQLARDQWANEDRGD
jgi:hypothetical protein